MPFNEKDGISAGKGVSNIAKKEQFPLYLLFISGHTKSDNDRHLEWIK